MPGELPERQVVVLEHALHRLEIELRRQVHHRAVLVVKAPMRLGARLVAADQAAPLVEMRADVAVEIHAHERRELHEARIDMAVRTRIAPRHGADQVPLEPVDRA